MKLIRQSVFSIQNITMTWTATNADINVTEIPLVCNLGALNAPLIEFVKATVGMPWYFIDIGVSVEVAAGENIRAVAEDCYLVWQNSASLPRNKFVISGIDLNGQIQVTPTVIGISELSIYGKMLISKDTMPVIGNNTTYQVNLHTSIKYLTYGN